MTPTVQEVINALIKPVSPIENTKNDYLLTNYVIKKYGVKKFLTFIQDMKSSPYLDTRAEHKLKTINPITASAINKEFGSVEGLSNGYLNYYKALYKK